MESDSGLKSCKALCPCLRSLAPMENALFTALGTLAVSWWQCLMTGRCTWPLLSWSDCRHSWASIPDSLHRYPDCKLAVAEG